VGDKNERRHHDIDPENARSIRVEYANHLFDQIQNKPCEQPALLAQRALLELPFEQVLISHGEPVHTRSAFERALRLAPWSG